MLVWLTLSRKGTATATEDTMYEHNEEPVKRCLGCGDEMEEGSGRYCEGCISER